MLGFFKRNVVKHKAGFVSIIGQPNVGKSTLMNQLVGERLSIITSKAQTTRHRIMGIISGEDFQVVYSDTPGIIKPQYSLQQSMMHFVQSSLNDADVILLVTDLFDKGLGDQKMLEKLNRGKVPILLLLNKIDLDKETKVEERLDFWKDQVKAAQYIPISALKNTNVEQVFSEILKRLPEHPAYFPKDNLTDKPERFFCFRDHSGKNIHQLQPGDPL